MANVSPIKKTDPRPVSINAEYLRLAQLFCSTDECRYYLMGVKIESHPEGGILLVATNGHIAGIFYDRLGYVPDPLLLELDKPFISSLKSTRNENQRRVTIRSERLVTMSVDTDDTFLQEKHIKPGQIEIDGTFPNWRSILPSPNDQAPVPCFDPSYIKIFQTVAKSLTGEKVSPVKLTATDKNGPMAVTTGHPDFFGVQMPMRYDIATCNPSWIK